MIPSRIRVVIEFEGEVRGPLAVLPWSGQIPAVPFLGDLADVLLDYADEDTLTQAQRDALADIVEAAIAFAPEHASVNIVQAGH